MASDGRPEALASRSITRCWRSEGSRGERRSSIPAPDSQASLELLLTMGHSSSVLASGLERRRPTGRLGRVSGAVASNGRQLVYSRPRSTSEIKAVRTEPAELAPAHAVDAALNAYRTEGRRLTLSQKVLGDGTSTAALTWAFASSVSSGYMADQRKLPAWYLGTGADFLCIKPCPHQVSRRSGQQHLRKVTATSV